jgi:NAD(P)-dependent dehydrogenase (short-subunit alcohol dehydrogenase family)
VWDDGRAGVIDLTGLKAVVTGGNGGIGLGMATGMAKAGANIAIWARDAAKSAEAVAGLEKLGVRALALTCREAARRFVDQGTGGSLVLVSSMISRFGGAGQSAYAASKTGVLGLSRTLAVELARHRVRVNALIPEWTVTGPEPEGGVPRAPRCR